MDNENLLRFGSMEHSRYAWVCGFVIFLPSCFQGNKAAAVCEFSDGLQVVQVDPLARGVSARTVTTAQGPKQVNMLAGLRIMFGYPGSDFFANVKVEKLPPAEYPDLRQILIENFNYLADSTPSTKHNGSIASVLGGIDARGMDRDKLDGGVIGLYLLFDDKRHVVSTIYLLNQDPERRHFQTLDEYNKLRDRFLSAYPSCVLTGM